MNRTFGVLLSFILLIGTIGATSLHAAGKSGLPTDHVQAVENHLQRSVYEKGKAVSMMNIEERMKHYHVPGVSIAVIHDGKIEWAKGYGVTDRNTNTPVSPDTLFQCASVSKPVTALGVLRLVELGLLNLDEPVNNKLKSWKIPENEFTTRQKVTLRHLLTHSAGLTVSGFPGYPGDAPLPTLLQILNGEKPANTEPIRVDTLPGSAWRYSGGGFAVLQQLVSDVTHQPFPEFMNTSVLEPLGMKHSAFMQPLPPSWAARAACAHESNGNMVMGKWHNYPELTAAGLWTTPSDLCRLAIELQQSRKGRSNQVISNGMTEQMLTPGVGNWGLGIGLAGTSADEDGSFSHGGGNKGFTCKFFAYINRGQGAVVMTNSDNGGNLVTEILRSISTVYDWTVLKSRAVTTIKLSPEQMKRFTGSYSLTDHPEEPFTVSVRDTNLQVNSSEGEWKLAPTSETDFVDMDSGIKVEFMAGPDGQIKQMKAMGVTLDKRR